MKRERDDARRTHPVVHEIDDTLRDDLGLARYGRRDDLRVAAPVMDRGERFAREHRDVSGICHRAPRSSREDRTGYHPRRRDSRAGSHTPLTSCRWRTV